MSTKIFNCKVKLPDTNGLLKKRNLETGGKVQMAIDRAVIDYSIPYCPFHTGVLANSPVTRQFKFNPWQHSDYNCLAITATALVPHTMVEFELAFLRWSK